jgi:Na+-driven multidrug efflux pump
LGFLLQQGLASGLETLCGQAYGAKQYHLVGIYLQRAIFALFLVAIPTCVISFYMAPILIAIGEDLADCSWCTSLWQVAGALHLGICFHDATHQVLSITAHCVSIDVLHNCGFLVAIPYVFRAHH